MFSSLMAGAAAGGDEVVGRRAAGWGCTNMADVAGSCFATSTVWRRGELAEDTRVC